MKPRISPYVAVVTICLSIMPARATTAPVVKAFPTAEGFGAQAVGGRGGRIIEVTNLNDAGEGSLRSAMEASGPRICVFRVSGTITLKDAIRVSTPYLTVAGQTSPGGVQIRGSGQSEGDWGVWCVNGAHDIILRHLRVRMGGNMKHDAGNNILFYGTAEPGVHDAIVDHCSVSWGSDTQLDWYGSYLDRATFQWNIIGECFMGQHIGGNRAPKNITLHHNLYANLGSRTPLMQHADAFDFRNNVIYNWSGNNAAVFGQFALNTSAFGNVVNNLWLAGPESGYPYLNVGNGGPVRVDGSSADEGGTKLYLSGNWGPRCPAGCANDWIGHGVNTWDYYELNHDGSTHLVDERQYGASRPFPAPAITLDPVSGLLDRVLASVGACKPSRDAVDLRIVASVRDKTGTSHGSTTGPWPDLAQGAPSPPADSDHDGMPDDWEKAHGLDPQDARDGSVVASNGYTNVENYLNELAGDPILESVQPSSKAVLNGPRIRVEADLVEGRLRERYLAKTHEDAWVEVATSEGVSGGPVCLYGGRGSSDSNSPQEIPATALEVSASAQEMTEIFSAGPCRIVRKISLDGGGPWLRVTTRLEPAQAVELQSTADCFAFSQRADWSYAPSIGGFNPDAQYKAPLVLVQSGRLAFGAVPDVTVLRRDTLQLCPHALDLEVTARPLLRVGFMPAQMARHSVYRPDARRRWTLGKPLENTYFLLVTAAAQTGQAYRQAVRFHWERFGRPSQSVAAEQQRGTGPYQDLGLFDQWRQRVWEQESRKAWLQIVLPDGAVGGGVGTRRALGPRSIYLSSWFNSLRTAFGMALYARRTNSNDLLRLATETVDLALYSPGADGAFKCIAALDKDDQVVWGAGDGSGGSTIQGYLGYDMSWTAYWLLRWREARLPGHERVLPRCRGLARFLIARQQPDGSFATFFDEAGNPLQDKAPFTIAETGPVALFLLKLYEAEKDPAYLDAAKKGLAFLDKEVIPQRKWYDFETFWSCSPRGIGFDMRTGQWPANNLALGQTVAAFLQAWRVTGDRGYLEKGESLLDYLLLYQQCWTNPLLNGLTGPAMLLGGFTTQNSDAEWSDARQSQCGNILLDYYRATGKTEYLERGVAALRAQFPISPSENWAHSGYGSKAGVSSFHWGSGSGMAGIEIEEEFLRDAIVDVASGTAVGVNGLNVTKCEIVAGKIALEIDSPFLWPRKPVLVFRNVGSSGDYALTVNGIAVGTYKAAELQRAVAVPFRAASPVMADDGVAAVSAVDFLNSLGVCTHIGQGIDNPSQSAAALAYAGLSNIRDDGNPRHVQDWLAVHEQAGVKVVLTWSGPNDNAIPTLINISKQLAAAGALLALEGPNEANNWAVTFEGQKSQANVTFLPVAKWQRAFYEQVKSDPVLKDYPVFHTSEGGGAEPDNVGLQFLTIPADANTLMPAGTKYADYANVHNYICRRPSIIDNMAWLNADPLFHGWTDGIYVEYGKTWRKGFAGYSNADLVTLPRVTTETGWVTGGAKGLTQEQQGRLYLNLYLAQFKQGFKYTFIYMLRDARGSDAGYGMFERDYQPKRAATYLHNLTTILSDKGTSQPGRLRYTIPSQPETVHDLPLQKSNGTFELVVWGEKAEGANSVTVNLGDTHRSVTLYDPTTGTTPTQVLTDAASVSLTLSDHPVIIEME